MTTIRKALRLLPLVLLFIAPHLSAQEAPLFALQWSDPSDPSRFAYQTAMVRLGESGWISMLKRHPEGRRAIVVTHPHNSIWKYPDDRCRASDGSLDGLSQSPKESSGMYKNATGSDGLPSGYSCPWLDGWVANEKLRLQPFVNDLVANKVDLDFMIFDVESQDRLAQIERGVAARYSGRSSLGEGQTSTRFT